MEFVDATMLQIEDSPSADAFLECVTEDAAFCPSPRHRSTGRALYLSDTCSEEAPRHALRPGRVCEKITDCHVDVVFLQKILCRCTRQACLLLAADDANASGASTRFSTTFALLLFSIRPNQSRQRQSSRWDRSTAIIAARLSTLCETARLVRRWSATINSCSALHSALRAASSCHFIVQEPTLTSVTFERAG